MLVLVRDDDFDDDTFVLLVVSNRKFQQFQSNNARRAKSLSDSNALLPLSGDRFEIALLFQGVALQVVLSSILLDFF